MKSSVLGAQLFTVNQYTKTIEDVRETCARIAKIGYEAVQISAFGPMDPKDVATAMEENGLTVAATHVAWPRFQNELDAVIEEHLLWKCKHAAIGALPPEYRNEDGLKRFVDELPPVSERLAAEGIDFSYHNHDTEFAPRGDRPWLQALYETASPDLLKAELDLYWVQSGGGDPCEWLRKCAGRQPLVHLKDMTITAKREQRFAPIGEGNMNWPSILRSALDGGVEWFLVEQDQCYGEDPFECLATSYRNLLELEPA